MSIPNPVNETQRRFNELCARGGGQRGGPVRTKVQALLAEHGRALNVLGNRDITEHLRAYSNHNPWHVRFAVGLSWGHLARLDLEFTGAAVRLIEDWNDDDLRLARTYHYERGPDPIEESLKGAYILLRKVVLPPSLPDSLDKYRDAQNRWLGQLITPVVMLPPGGPIFAGLSILHKSHLLSRLPAGSDLDDEAFEPGAIYENNALFQEIHRGYSGWNLLDVHSGVYMLGTRLAESDSWL